jgi:hypothetical protein
MQRRYAWGADVTAMAPTESTFVFPTAPADAAEQASVGANARAETSKPWVDQ